MSSPSPVLTEPEPHPVTPPPSSLRHSGSCQDPHGATGPAGPQQEPRQHGEESGSYVWLGGGGSAGHSLGSVSSGMGPGVRHGAGQGLREVASQESHPHLLASAASYHHSLGAWTGDAWGPMGSEAAHARVPRRSQTAPSLSHGGSVWVPAGCGPQRVSTGRRKDTPTHNPNPGP